MLKLSSMFNPFPYRYFENTVEEGENTVGKGEIAHNEQIILFRQCFLTCSVDFLPFPSKFELSSANSFSLEESKIWCLGKG